MNLLIVDDEDITREGIIQRLPWSELGIQEIQQADDGINALRIVEKFKPDIVLTDVRMPRLDGIQMSSKLKELFPDCVILFMSGYSDREYLKAAIQLEAVDYIDKPIIIKELKAAVEKAVARLKSSQIQEQTEQAVEAYIKVGIPLLRSELALSLFNGDIDSRLILEKAKAAQINLPEQGFYTSAIVKFLHNEKNSIEHLSSIKAVVFSSLENAYQKYKVKGISAFKNDDYLILHLWCENFEKHLLTQDKLLGLLKDITLPLIDLCGFVASVGKTVQGLNSIQDSYKTALYSLDRAFFKETNSILFYEKISSTSYVLDSTMIKNFTELADEERREEAIFFIKSLVSNLRRHENTPVNNIKDFFYTLLLELYKLSHQKGIDLFQYTTGENHIWEMFLKFNSLTEIEEFLMEKLNTYFEISKQKSKNYSLIDKIYKYVQGHYSDPDLSIDKISEYTHFAPTYICSVFKEKTDKTLNQYITEFRIEKAKDYLKDPEIKVSEIASKVGCRDSGYFTKLFRKSVGITPSEYRDRIIP